MESPKLNLFYFESCPFCQKVMSKIKELEIEVEYSNIMQSEAYVEKLISDLGRKTVPVLYINDSPMPESQAIINWLDENQSNLKKA